MVYALGFVALVVLVQAVAWMGSPRTGTRRRAQATMLAPISLAVLLVCLLHVLVPGFWS